MQGGHRVLHGRSHRLESDSYRPNNKGKDSRYNKHHRVDGYPIIIAGQPMMQKIVRHWRRDHAAHAHQQQEVPLQQDHHLSNRRAQNFVGAASPRSDLRRRSSSTEVVIVGASRISSLPLQHSGQTAHFTGRRYACPTILLASRLSCKPRRFQYRLPK